MSSGEINLGSLKEILKSIKEGKIEYGDGKEYCFFLDEDGLLILRKMNNEGEYDKIIWSFETYQSRGLGITELFLKSLEIEFIQ
tara:strand:- start:79946 stop:80197 length:252 start_codon:yes stop_codon:yes gene_type:complete